MQTSDLLQQPQEQRYPLLPVCAVFKWVQTKVWLQLQRIFTCAQILMHRIAHGSCTDTVREFALIADSERIPCRTRESNLPQRLYQLSYIPAPSSSG